MELINLIKRELKIIYHKIFDVFNIFIFFIIISFAFSFAASGNISLQIGTAIIIVCFMLSANLSGHFIFGKDIETGVLQQLFIRTKNLNNLVFAKIISQFLCFGIPLCFAVPISAIFFNISSGNITTLMILIVFTSFILSVINVMMAGVTAGLKNGGLISVILSVPLYIPIIILNISFIESRASGDGELELLTFIENITGLALVIIPLAIFSIRQTIRNAVEN